MSLSRNMQIESELSHTVIAYITGSVFTVIGSAGYWSNLEEFSLKMFSIFIIGTVGGFSGLFGKKLFGIAAKWWDKNQKK